MTFSLPDPGFFPSLPIQFPRFLSETADKPQTAFLEMREASEMSDGGEAQSGPSYSMSNMRPVLLFAASPPPEKPDQQDQDRKPADPQHNHPSALPVTMHIAHESSSRRLRMPT